VQSEQRLAGGEEKRHGRVPQCLVDYLVVLSDAHVKVGVRAQVDDLLRLYLGALANAEGGYDVCDGGGFSLRCQGFRLCAHTVGHMGAPIWLDVHNVTICLLRVHHSGLDAVRLAALSLRGAFARSGLLHSAIRLGFGELVGGYALVEREEGAVAYREGPPMVATKVVALFDLVESAL
jgi:hypothetical protein